MQITLCIKAAKAELKTTPQQRVRNSNSLCHGKRRELTSLHALSPMRLKSVSSLQPGDEDRYLKTTGSQFQRRCCTGLRLNDLLKALLIHPLEEDSALLLIIKRSTPYSIYSNTKMRNFFYLELTTISDSKQADHWYVNETSQKTSMRD